MLSLLLQRFLCLKAVLHVSSHRHKDSRLNQFVYALESLTLILLLQLLNADRHKSCTEDLQHLAGKTEGHKLPLKWKLALHQYTL